MRPKKNFDKQRKGKRFQKGLGERTIAKIARTKEDVKSIKLTVNETFKI